MTCIAFSVERGVWSAPGSGVLATGSHDATVLVWRWCGKQRRVVGPLSGQQESEYGSTQSCVCMHTHAHTVYFSLSLSHVYVCICTHTHTHTHPTSSSSHAGQTVPSSVAPEAILTGHEDSVVCVDVSASLGLVVSGAKREPAQKSCMCIPSIALASAVPTIVFNVVYI